MHAPSERDAALDALKGGVRAYYERFLGPKPFVPGESPVPVSGKVYDHEEIELLLEASLDCWWTEGRFTQDVAPKLAAFLGARDVMLCNSGSRANPRGLTPPPSPPFPEQRARPA